MSNTSDTTARALQQETLSSHLAYWKEQLAGASPSLYLPTDRPRLLTPTYRGGTYPFALSRKLTDALKTLSLRENVTLFMTMVAAFQILLHRYSEQEDIVIGATISDRRYPEVQKLLGFFLSTVVLRGNLAGNPTFRDLLKQTRKVTLEAQAHQDVPFDVLIKELQPERNPGEHPLFQVMLSFQPSLPALPSGWTIMPMDVQTDAAKFDLYLELDDRPEGLIGRFEYSSDLFDEATIARMCGHWLTLLEGIVDNPDRCLSDVPLLTPAERQQLLIEWNATTTSYPSNLCLHQLFEAQVARTPNAPALLFADQQMTYQELNEKAHQLACYLQRQGVGPDMPVGIYMERCLEMVIALLGVLKAGGAYVPLDPTYPAERLAFMLEDSQISVLVTQQHLLPRLVVPVAKVVCLDADEAILARQSEADLVCGATSDHRAYIIYTSGSTGRPKGVQILHRSVVNFLMSMRRQPGLTAEDTWLSVTTLSFDIAALELFLPLIVGARVIIASRDIVANGAALAETLVRGSVTVLQATPATWHLLLAAGWSGKADLKILCGGEALPLDLAQQLLPRAASLWNMYGPTETTIWSTVCKVEPVDEVVTIGRPIANTQIYLLDTHMQPVPVGLPGELYIGGAGLALGYLHQPELTAEKFVSNPFSNDPESRLYRTGDLARYRPDGTIDFLGRIDYQVKIRGLRIELGEIESVLRQLPEIREAVVVAREDKPGDKRLVAYITTSQKHRLTMESLVKALKEKLPDYMLPSAFVQMEALPLTPNGKVDRRALPVPSSPLPTSEESFVAPTLLLHYQLQQVWEELLDARPIGIRDNFFYLGGHSWLAARLVNRIEQNFGKKIPLATLFAGPTIESLANALQAEEKSSHVPLIPLQANGTRRPFFYLPGSWNSGAFYCFSLARHLGPDQPFYVLEPYHFSSLQISPTVEAMAAAHLESIRAVQPEGPYLLGGFCNGGLVAYEMARQLQAQGEQVDTLVLIDPAYPPVLHKLVCCLINRVGNLLGVGQDKQLEWFLRLRHVYKYLRHERNTDDLKEFSAIDPSIHTLFPTANALWQDNVAIFNWLIANYNYGPYAGKITLLWACKERFGGVWRLKARKEKNIEVHVIPGTHISCRTTHISGFAEALKRCLNTP